MHTQRLTWDQFTTEVEVSHDETVHDFLTERYDMHEFLETSSITVEIGRHKYVLQITVDKEVG